MQEKNQNRPHVKVFELDSKVISNILKRGKPMTTDEFLALEPCEILTPETWALRRKHQLNNTFEVPKALWELFFPKYVLATGFICTPSWFTYEWKELEGTCWIPDWCCIPISGPFA